VLKLCDKCSRCKSRRKIVMPSVHYLGQRPDLFVLGESPGVNEDMVGKPFIGQTGKLLRTVLAEVTDEFILDNTVRCFSDAKPNAKQIDACRHHWVSMVAKHKPKVIVALGNYSAEAILGRKIKISKYVGQSTKIDIDGESYLVIFNYHPSYIYRLQAKKGTEYERVMTSWYDAWDLIQVAVDGKMKKAPKTLKLTKTKDIVRFLKWLSSYKGEVSYDYETWGDKNALRPELCDDFKILSVGVGLEENHTYPQGVSFIFDTMNKDVLSDVQCLWQSVIDKPGRIAQNAKYEHKCNLKRFGHTSYLKDTMLAMNTINETASANLAAIGQYCKISWSGYKLEMGETQRNPANATVEQLLKYSALEGMVTRMAWSKLYNEVRKLKLDNILEMRQNFAMHLAHVEMTGMHISAAVVAKVRSTLSRELEHARNKFNVLPAIKKTEKWAVENIKSFKEGDHFNPKSPKQMQYLCLQILKLKVKPAKWKWKDGKRTKGTISLNKTVLAKFEDKHPVLKDLAKVRSLSSMFSGFLDKYEDFTGPDGCVHTNYTQEIVVTGRLSSIAPNLQNIPVESPVRKVFTSRYKNGWLISADYAQLEPRILAGWSRDSAMCKALNEGMDLHRFVASRVYSVDYDDVTDKQRHVAKRRNLGSMYGQTVEGLADATGLSLADAQKIVDIYDKTFPDVKRFRVTKHKEAVRYGKVKDLFGSVRHLPNAQTGDIIKKERALRQASNFPIQSTGNLFHLIALCVLRSYLENDGIKAVVVGVEHDKIYADCANSALRDTINLINKAMLIHNDAWYWKDKPVKMKVDFKYGRNLYKMEKWDDRAM